MNKQLTKKIIGIAASAALIASVAFSGTAIADPNPNKGPKPSITIDSWCEINTADLKNVIFTVNSRINDASSESFPDTPSVTKYEFRLKQGKGNSKGGNKYQVFGAPKFGPLGEGGVDKLVYVQFNLCTEGLSPFANAVNANITVEIDGGHKTFPATCADNPATEEDESIVTHIGHLGLCPAP
jgi:hypothetical protein